MRTERMANGCTRTTADKPGDVAIASAPGAVAYADASGAEARANAYAEEFLK